MHKTEHLLHQSATELIAALAQKKISCSDLLETTIQRIETEDKNINAIVVRDFDRARVTAQQTDAALAQGKRLPLLGLPITVKESFNVAGLPTSWGNPQFKNWYPNEDSLVVARLKAAGAIIIGKTNVPFMLSDYQSYNDIYGTTHNPCDLTKTCGGSSGGSAAALAADLVTLELGSDLAGSLRVPANFCGVYAHKPSFGVIPLTGITPPTNPQLPGFIDFVVAGPMARTANDLRLEFDVLAGPDENTMGKGYQLALPKPRHTKLKDFRVLIIDSHPLCPVADSVSQSFHQLSDRLVKNGAKVTQQKNHLLPDLINIGRTYSILLSAFMSVNMPPEIHAANKVAVNTLTEGDFGSLACYLRGSTMAHKDWLTLSRTRAQLQHEWRDLYKDFDVILCPTMPTPAFPHDYSNLETRTINIDGQHVYYWDQKVWCGIATLFGLPATIAPINKTAEGLPVGVQIIGDYLEDYTTLHFAHLLEREFNS